MAELNQSPELPRYKCHKDVRALKIQSVEYASEGAAYLHFEDKNYCSFLAPFSFIKKHNPKAGGYYVVYGDGYISFSPAKAFEEGYSRI